MGTDSTKDASVSDRTILQYQPQVLLFWLRTHPTVYRPLFSQVIREICSYFPCTPPRLLRLTHSTLSPFDVQSFSWGAAIPLQSFIFPCSISTYITLGTSTVVACGWYSDKRRDNTWRFDFTTYLVEIAPDQCKVRRLPVLKRPRRCPGLYTTDGKVIAFGGKTNTQGRTELQTTGGLLCTRIHMSVRGMQTNAQGK